MAERWAVATGNWSNTATWNGGTLPGATDDVYANGFTVTIDQDITVKSLRFIAGTTAVQGGVFTCSTSVTITLDELSVGSFTGGSATPLLTLTAGTSTVNVAGAITGDQSTTGAEPVALYVTGGTHTVNADVQGGAAGASPYGMRVDTATVTINGDITSGAAASGLLLASTGARVTVRGSLIVAGTFPAVTVTSGVLRFSGDAYAGGITPSTGAAGTFPISGVFVLIAGEETNFHLADDSDFPTSAGGAEIVATTSGGGGGVTPKRFLNVGGVATAIQ
jgi:hypothetical protein